MGILGTQMWPNSGDAGRTFWLLSASLFLKKGGTFAGPKYPCFIQGFYIFILTVAFHSLGQCLASFGCLCVFSVAVNWSGESRFGETEEDK